MAEAVVAEAVMPDPTAAPTAALTGMPVELMSIIAKAVSSDNKPILSSQDIFSLRLSSRSICNLIFDAFAFRFFRTRKHILSRVSLQCLLDIAHDRNLGKYVKEVVLDSTRVTFRLEDPDSYFTAPPEVREQWQTTIDEQKEFEDSGKAVDMLNSAFKALSGLKNVHINTIPARNASNRAEKMAWGFNKLLGKISTRQFAPWANFLSILVNDGGEGGTMHEHCSRVMQAPGGIEDRQDWKLELSFHPGTLRHKDLVFQFSLSEWVGCRGRVRKVTLSQTYADSGGPGLFDHIWLVSLLHDCVALESLTLDREYGIVWLCRNLHLRKLRHIVIQRSDLPCKSFFLFLERHARSLETITCWNALLYDHLEPWSD